MFFSFELLVVMDDDDGGGGDKVDDDDDDDHDGDDSDGDHDVADDGGDVNDVDSDTTNIDSNNVSLIADCQCSSPLVCEHSRSHRLPYRRQETEAIGAGNQTVSRSQADAGGTESATGEP